MPRTPAQQIKHYLKTGESDILPAGWGGNWIESGKAAHEAMTQAIIDEVRKRTRNLPEPTYSIFDEKAFTRKKVTPMVQGLFSAEESENVLSMLEGSVIFLRADNLEIFLRHSSGLRTTWILANMYLASLGAAPLSDKAKPIVGLSEETTCYVSLKYFEEDDRFADFVVHEAAHVFHNSKRATIGLPETRKKEFLLNVDYKQRETFAYACEVYSRILELADNRADRIKLAAEAAREFHPPCDNVDIDRFRAALIAAGEARNGWKKILEICAPAKRKRLVEVS